ncbi:hypothetical protein BKA65DRAFT_489003 [Rhexocercosporidium sp. MPI-PUGE-AT-0058]|nr:hypothetical protein BKA65DRAFT_489003 [Rhexocercosporidium sp. MPI-PUGE-AT-0058]
MYHCKCGYNWAEPRDLGKNLEQHIPDMPCHDCFPDGWWRLHDCWRTREQHYVADPPASEEGGPVDGPTTKQVRFETESDWEDIEENNEDAEVLRESDISSLANPSLGPESLSSTPTGTSINVEVLIPRRRASSPPPNSTINIAIPSYLLSFDPEDFDGEDKQEARGFRSNYEQDPDDDDGDMQEARGFWTDEQDPNDDGADLNCTNIRGGGQDDEDSSSEDSTLSDLGDFSLKELEEIEDAHPEHMDEDDTLEVFSNAETAREVTIWSPESGHVRIDITVRSVSPDDLVLQDFEPESEESQSLQSATDWPARLPESPLVPETRPLDNAIRVQEVRDFLSIPATVPTRSIPSFINNHLRVAGSLQAGIVLTQGRLAADRPYIWVLSADQQRMAEIYGTMLNIVWEDDHVEQVSEPASNEESVEDSDEPWESVAASRLDIVHLDEEDEAYFWEAIEASQTDTSRLVGETQQPRLRTNPESPHRVLESSDLIVEVFARFDGLETDSEKLG